MQFSTYAFILIKIYKSESGNTTLLDPFDYIMFPYYIQYSR